MDGIDDIAGIQVIVVNSFWSITVVENCGRAVSLSLHPYASDRSPIDGS